MRSGGNPSASTAARASVSRTARSRAGGKARERGCEPAPSVRTATAIARPSRHASAISPPQPRLSSSGWGARTRTGPPPMIVS